VPSAPAGARSALRLGRHADRREARGRDATGAARAGRSQGADGARKPAAGTGRPLHRSRSGTPPSGWSSAEARNPSFETAADGVPHNWMLWVKPMGDPPYGTMEWTQTDEARSGEHCLVIEGLKRGGPVQAVRARPGRYVMIAAYRLHQPIERNRLELSTILKTGDNVELSFGMQSNVVFVEMRTGGWRIAMRPFVVPERVGDAEVGYVQIAPIVEYMKPGERIDLDDVAIYRIGD